ncbi:MAG: prohibitin family protein [Oscillospiraceae bacterium]|jgi:regulator of protease activity HflC (stomatin/prohibitin superfamily)|nr:prohibitin family protein [Oscillospiraceae bacterium]
MSNGNPIPIRPERKQIRKWIVLGVAALAALIVLASTFTVVPAGHTGVVVTMGKVSTKVMQEGMHIKVPFIQQVEKISNKIQVIEVAAAAVSKDIQQVNSTIAVNYRVGLQSSANIYKNIGPAYSDVVLMPAIQESMKSVTARYTAEELIAKRSQVGQEIKETLSGRMEDYGIEIDKFNIVNFEFSQEFNNAIEAKQVAEQNLIKTKTEQEQAIVIAEAEAKKQVIAAEAEAKAITAKAESQAAANRLLTQSLSDVLVEYQKVQKWDGKLPQATGATPILNLNP